MQPEARIDEAMKQLRIARDDVDDENAWDYLQTAVGSAEAALVCLEGPEVLEGEP